MADFKLSKWVENTVGKGEIACYEQFLLFPQCFQKACFPGSSSGVIVWEWVKLGKKLITSNNVLRRLFPQGLENKGLFRKALTNHLTFFKLVH